MTAKLLAPIGKCNAIVRISGNDLFDQEMIFAAHSLARSVSPLAR